MLINHKNIPPMHKKHRRDVCFLTQVKKVNLLEMTELKFYF